MQRLTSVQKSVIIGSILGDGYLRVTRGRNDAFLEINHSLKAKEYVDWKYKILKNLVKSPPKQRENGKKWKIAYRFYTRQHPELTCLLKKFYRNGRKVIPKDLELNPLILAVWFIDDGSKTKKSNVYLNTQQFSFKDQRRLLYLLRKLGIEARLNKNKKYYRIRILKESIQKLNKLIGPYIIPPMRYKLSYDPVETSPRDRRELSKCGELKRQPLI